MENTYNKKYIDTLTAINEIFDFCNKTFFENTLSKPIITIQQDVKCRAYGWFSVDKVWKCNKDIDGKHDGEYEINVSANFLNRSKFEVCATLLHEMVHLDNQIKGIKDCSRGNVYHNKTFKETAEKRGLIIEKVPKIGYSSTTLSENAKNLLTPFLSKYDEFLFRLVQKDLGISKKSSTRKYVCPVCGMSVRATKNVHIKCVDCDEIMTCENSDD